MGCLRLTYDHGEEPTLFLERAPEKIHAPELRVWVNPESEIFGVEIKTQTQGGPLTTFDILHSSIYDNGRMDWFLETTQTPTNTGYLNVQRAAILTYDKKGNLVDYIGKQRAFETFEYGTLEQNYSPTKYINQPYAPSTFMLGVVSASINFNCGGCITAPTLWDKYWDFILSPNNIGPKNRLDGVSSPHR